MGILADHGLDRGVLRILTPDAKSPDEIIAASWMVVAAMIATFPAGVLAIFFVHGVDSNQQNRYDLYLQRQAATGLSDLHDSPPGEWQSASEGGEQFAPPASRPAASGDSGEGIDDWLNKL